MSDAVIREGFLCPICMQDLGTVTQLLEHFDAQHSDDKDVLEQLKGELNIGIECKCLLNETSGCLRTNGCLLTNDCLLTKGKFLYSAISNSQDCSKRFTLSSLAHLFNQTPSQPLWKASSHMLQLMHECCSYTYSFYPPLSVVQPTTTVNAQRLLIHISTTV